MATKYIYTLLAVTLLACLFPMPYGYYSLLRFVSMCTFSYLAYKQYLLKQENLMFIFAALALLFQPFIKLPLGRVVWNIVDVVVALSLITLWIKNRKSK